MEGSIFPSNALTDDFGVSIHKNRRRASLRSILCIGHKTEASYCMDHGIPLRIDFLTTPDRFQRCSVEYYENQWLKR